MKSDLLKDDRSSECYLLNVTDVQMKPKVNKRNNTSNYTVEVPLKLFFHLEQPQFVFPEIPMYKVPDMVKRTSVAHFVDASINMSRTEPFASGTSYYLLLSQDKCQTFWHQDFSATSVLYTVLTSEKIFFLIAPHRKEPETF